MGLSHSWVAVRTADSAAVLAALDLAVSEDGRGEIRGFGVAELPGPWVLLVKRDYDWAFKVAQKLSTHSLTIACGEEEHVMASDACAYDGGALVWRVTRNPEDDDNPIKIAGAPPPALNRILEELRAEEAADDDEISVDYIFDAPPRLAKEVVGFGLTDGLDDGAFKPLRRVGQPGLLERFFGKR